MNEIFSRKPTNPICFQKICKLKIQYYEKIEKKQKQMQKKSNFSENEGRLVVEASGQLQ